MWISRWRSTDDQQLGSLHEGIQLDMTTKASAEYGGVSAEMEQHLGITVDADPGEVAQ